MKYGSIQAVQGSLPGVTYSRVLVLTKLTGGWWLCFKFRHPLHISLFRKFLNEDSQEQEGLNGVNRQPSNGPKINRQPSKTEYFYRQPSNERAKLSRQISKISLNDRDRLT